MSRNSDKLSFQQNNEDFTTPPEVAMSQTNLSFPCPVESVDLPSKGSFYPEGHILHNVDSIEIREMTAADEEILTSKTLIQKGVAVEKMIQGLLINQNIKLDDVLVGDKNAIIMAARITMAGPIYETHIICPVCNSKETYKFDLTKIKHTEPPEGVVISPEGIFSINLSNGKVLQVKMLMGKDEKFLRAKEESKKKHKLPLTPLTDQLKAIIVSVDGNSDREVVERFVDKELSARHSRFIREEYARATPNLDLTQDIQCASCGNFSKVGIPLRPDFLWS